MYKGLVSYKLKNNTKYYSATPPDKILVDLKEKQEIFKVILPTLKEIMKKPYEEEVKIDIFKGYEGLKAIANDMIKHVGGEFLTFGEQGQLQKNYPNLCIGILLSIEHFGQILISARCV